MDFAVPAPAGIGPADPALLRSRGADPLVEIPAAHFFRTVAGLPFQPVPGALSSTPNALPYSVVESVLGPMIAVDRTVMGGAHESPFLSSLILPAKFEAALAQSFFETPNVKLDPSARYTSLSAAAAAVREFVGRLDATNLHAAYMLTVPDLYPTEPVPGALPAPYRHLYAAGTAVTFDNLSNGNGFLTHLGFLGFVMFGRALTSSRDTLNSPTRSSLLQVESMAASADLSRAGTNLSSTTLKRWLDLTDLPMNLAYLTEIGSNADRRDQCLRDRHLFVYGDTSQKEAILAQLVLLDPLRGRLPNVSQVLGQNCTPVDARVSILQMVRSVLVSATADMSNIATLYSLEPALKNLVPSLTMPSLVGADLTRRVSAIVKAAGEGHAYGSTGAISDSAGVTSATVGSIDKVKANIFADDLAHAMGQNAWRAVEAQLAAELASPHPSSLRLHDLIVNSPILGARRLVLGSKDAALSSVLGLSKTLTQAILKMDSFRATASLMLVCDLSTFSVTEHNLVSFRLPAKTAAALNRGAFDEINWVTDILVEVIRARDPYSVAGDFPDGLFDARVPPLLTPLVQRVSRLLGLPQQPLLAPSAAPSTALVAAGALVPAPPPPPVISTSLDQIISTISTEYLDITGRQSPFNEDYLMKLRHFESTAWQEAADEFQRNVILAKNPAGSLPTSVLPHNSAARGVLALMRANRTRNRADANANPATHAILTEIYRTGSIKGQGSSSPTRNTSTRPRLQDYSRSPSRSPERAWMSSPSDARQQQQVVPGSRVATTLFFSADGSAFWYTSPDTRQRVSPVYDYDSLERIARKTREQLDFPVLLSTMPPHKRLSLCAHSHLADHQTLGSPAHRLPFADFLDQVNRHFQEPTDNGTLAVGMTKGQNSRERDGRRRGGDPRRQRGSPYGKSPNPDDARRTHQLAPPPRHSILKQQPADDRRMVPAQPHAQSPKREARPPSRSRSRERSRSPARRDSHALAQTEAPLRASATSPTTQAGHPRPPDAAASPHERPASRGTSPTATRPSTSQRAKWAAGLLPLLPGASGAPSSARRTHTHHTPPLLSLTDNSHTIVRTILLVVALSADTPMRLLVPPSLDEVVGVSSVRSAPRSAAIATAHLLAASLKLPGVDLAAQCISIAERIPALGDAVQSVDRIVALPLNAQMSAAAARALLVSLPGWRWLTLGALGGLAIYALAALAFARIRSYFPSSSVASARTLLEQRAHLRAGGREHRPVSTAAARRRHGSNKRTREVAQTAGDQWRAARSSIAAADNMLQRMLLAVPDSDPDAEGLRAFADLLRPINEEEIPPSFKLTGGLPTFSRADLYWQPFSVRVGPPRTSWLPRLPRQKDPPPNFNPHSIQDLLEPLWFAKLSTWYERLGSWLLDLSEANQPDGPTLERLLASRPKTLVIPASGFVHAARGVIWDLRHGHPRPADFTLPINTHLNLPLIRRWMLAHPDFPDRELFSHLLEGVRFKTEPATQMVLQPHLSSLAQGFVSVHRELVRLTEKGFFEVYAHPPFAPWITLPMGVAFRKLEPDRPRRTTDGGAPRKGLGASQFLVDADGVRVLPVNLLAKHPAADIKNGTSPIFADGWRSRLHDCGANPSAIAHSVVGARSRLSRRPLRPPAVLLLFAGRGSHPLTLEHQLTALGLSVRAVDRFSGGPDDDLANPLVVAQHVRAIADNTYSFVFVATPCSSYSIAADDGRPQLRSRAHPRGLPSCPGSWRAYVDRHNTLADSTIACILAAERSATPWAIENPAPRWDDASPARWRRFADWGTLWDILAAAGVAPSRLLPPHIEARAAGVLEVTFAACAFGAPYQKYTTIWASQGASSLVARLRDNPCPHASAHHAAVLQGRELDGAGVASQAAEYVPALASAIADGVDSVVHAACLAAALSLQPARPASPARPTTGPRPAPPALRDGNFVDVDVTRTSSTPLLLSNPFKLGDAGKDERLRQLAFVVYSDWLELRTVRAAEMASVLPVATSMRDVTGDAVLAEVQRIVTRYGPDNAFHLVCGRRCHGKLCHAAILASLFQQVADCSGALPFPKELKPTVPEIMSDLAVLMHLSSLTGIPVYQIVSDVKDFFNQHHLAPEDKHKVGSITLDPRAIVAHAEKLRRAEPALANIAENVLGYGLTCASNICQRTAHLLVFIFLVEMQLAAASVVNALRRRHPAIDAWLADRARLLEAAAPSPTYQSVRYSQARLWSVSMYTDDGHQAILGPELTVIALRVWRKIMGELRLTMAIVQKHGIGQQVTVQGCRFNTGLGIVFVPEDKLRRAIHELDAAVAGQVCLREYHSLVSFLQSLTFVIGMSRSAAYGLFTPLTRSTADPEAILLLSHAVKQQLLQWRSRLLHHAGAPLHAAVDHFPGGRPVVVPATASVVFYLRSDASKDGARLPGLGGALGALLWRYPQDSSLSAAELNLPIAVLEFAAYFGTVEAYADLIASDVMVVSEVDALASADAITLESARSSLMQHIHARLLALPAFQCLDGRHAVGHVFGEANVMADAASRGNYLVARELASQLGMTLEWRPHGPLLPLLMRELVDLHRHPGPPNTALGQTALGTHNIHMTGSPMAHTAGAICADGAPGALFRRYPRDSSLSAAELDLPVAVLEFAAFFGAVEAYAGLLASDVAAISEIDDLLSADTVTFESARWPHGPFPLLLKHHELVDLYRHPAPPNTALGQTALGAHNIHMTGSPMAHTAGAICTDDLELLLDDHRAAVALLCPSWSSTPPLPHEPPHAPVLELLPFHHVLSPAPPPAFLDRPARLHTVLPSADQTATSTIASLLLHDASDLALRPTAFALRDLCAELYNPSTAQPTRTSLGQNSAWKHWTAWCAANNTAPWRLTRHATDTDHHREAVLQAGFIRFCHLRQSTAPRNGRRAALVSSALKSLCHVRKMHRDRNFPMCPSPLVTAQVRRLLFEYKAAHGVDDMIPKRKEPFTRHILVDVLLATPDGFATNLGRLSWHTRLGRSLRALITTLAQAGFRKGEVSVTRAGSACDANCLSRAALSWLLGGRAYASGDAPAHLLSRLRPGDFAVLTPCPSKSDPFDMVWGGDPIWLPFQAAEPLCACAALACVDLHDAVPELVRRQDVALFTTDAGSPLSDAQLDRLLQCLLTRALPPASVKLYSWHSARIFLATTLLASGASHPEIQALCRWQTTDSIKIYARLTSAFYSRLLDGAMAARVSTARAQNLALAVPFIDMQDVRRAAAAAPQPHPAAHDNIDLDVHPDDDADNDDPDGCRDEPARGVCCVAAPTAVPAASPAPLPRAVPCAAAPGSPSSAARARPVGGDAPRSRARAALVGGIRRACCARACVLRPPCAGNPASARALAGCSRRPHADDVPHILGCPPLLSVSFVSAWLPHLREPSFR